MNQPPWQGRTSFVFRLAMFAVVYYMCIVSVASQPLSLPPLAELQQQMQQRDYAGVYQKLELLEYEFAGNPAYDALFGLAALRSGDPARASWALERLVLVEPDNLNAKLALARAYMELNRFNRAQGLLDEVRQMQPAARILQAAEQLQAELEEKRAPKHWQLTGHIVAGTGYDTNVGSAPGTFIHEIAGPVRIDEEASAFSEIVLRHRLQYSSDEDWRFFGGYRLREYRPYSATDYLRHHFTTETGAIRNAGNWRLSLEPSLTKVWRDSDEESREGRITANTRYQINQRTYALGFITYSRLSYDQNTEDNGDFLVLGGGLAQMLSVSGKPLTLSTTAYYLSSDQPDSASGDMRSLGADINATWRLTQKMDANGRLGWIQRDYACSLHPAVCNSDRDDTQWRISIGGSYRLSERLRIESQVSHARQESNVDQYEYKRTVAKVSVRYEFKPWRK
ncbi:hypothetical protein Selin_0213 [Desulfurispirillum indicum S5]|uniref:Uncharacterized protein n=1 Tax=Desulfurispirillum indicum (strain ATCC BAA-1389 / DSM 22839 / S5) TaxID=653733 RepID=E6W631_DESIS|nr:outer membrane beta-barrel protein [Desulfurispirillum indicum]ADU64970.1 hypothetical protein Selin_0213 [Desulfurispirillum indicum S5]